MAYPSITKKAPAPVAKKTVQKPGAPASVSGAFVGKKAATATQASTATSDLGCAGSFTEIYALPPMDRIDVIRHGFDPTCVNRMAVEMDMPEYRLWSLLGLPRSTMNRKVKQQKTLSPEESERVLGMATIIGQVETMVRESGNPEGFDAAKWVAEWINTPVPALGGRKPAELLDTVHGQNLVSKVLSMSQTGAYA